MLKLVHHLLADYANIAFMQNDKIFQVSMEYIIRLSDVQESSGILPGNKLKKKHTAWDVHSILNLKIFNFVPIDYYQQYVLIIYLTNNLYLVFLIAYFIDL